MDQKRAGSSTADADVSYSFQGRIRRGGRGADTGAAQTLKLAVLVQRHFLVGLEIDVDVENALKKTPVIVAAVFQIGGGQFLADFRVASVAAGIGDQRAVARGPGQNGGIAAQRGGGVGLGCRIGPVTATGCRRRAMCCRQAFPTVWSARRANSSGPSDRGLSECSEGSGLRPALRIPQGPPA